MEVREQKKQVLKRTPPGDRWVFYRESVTDKVTDGLKLYESLTDALESWYQIHGDTKFYIDARQGAVYVVWEEKVEPKPDKRFSIYGED